MSNKNNRNNQYQQQSKDQATETQETVNPQTPATELSPVDQPLDTSNPTELSQATSQLPNLDTATETPQLPPTLPADTATEVVDAEKPLTVEAVETKTVLEPVQEPVAKPLQAKPVVTEKPSSNKFGRGNPLKPVMQDNASVADYLNNAVNNNDLNMQILIEALTKLELRLGPKTISPMEDVAKNMVGLHNTLVGVINNAKTVQEFKDQWTVVLQFFKDNEKTGLGMHRVYRGAPYWPKSQDHYLHYQALLNAIYTTNNFDKEVWSKNINFTALTKDPITDAGRGRLLSYYL